MVKRRITDVAESILESYLPEHGYSLYHSEFVKEGRDWFLRIYIDKNDGPMSTSDCEMVSRYLSDKLDESDVKTQNYYLVVSSPGIDRELFTAEHYMMFTGSDVDVSLYRAVDGEKNISGRLTSYDEENMCIETERGSITIPTRDVSKTKLTVKF